MTQLNVAIAVPIFPNIIQTYVLSQIAAFKEFGVNTSIIAGVKRTYEQLPSMVSTHHMLDDVIYISTEPKHLPGQLVSLPVLNASYRSAVRQILTARSWNGHEGSYRFKALIRARALAFRPFDIIHSHSMFSSYNYLFMKELLSIPLVTTYHGQVPRGVNKLADDKLNMVLDQGDAFMVNTGFARDELIGLGCRVDKIHVIPQGTILGNFPFHPRSIEPGQKIILLTVGRLSVEKGHKVAIDAVRKLSETFPTLEYHIVGDGPNSENLVDRVRQHGLQNRVVFHGFKTGDELKAVFESAHIFVLPSINTGDGYLIETQGVVLQEAQAGGIPVVGSRTGGIPDVIDNEATGLLYTEGDSHELAGKIRRLIIAPNFYQEIAHSGRNDVEKRFDINIVAKQLIAVYRTILERL